MSFKIGFSLGGSEKKETQKVVADPAAEREIAVKSVVQVHFPKRGLTCSYYNDMFDLHKGDIVYVEGKLEGFQGRVVDVEYNFKIKLSDYKRVIGKAYTNVKGEFKFSGTHLLTFDRSVLPYEKIITWYKAPENSDEEYVIGSDGSGFMLSDLTDMKIQQSVAEHGKEYYLEGKVVYISIDGGKGRAIVEGSKPYEVEFCYEDGRISDLVCDCYCVGACKHGFAAMLQLREMMKVIEEKYGEEFKKSGYFAAVQKSEIFFYAFCNKDTGSIRLDD